MFNWLKKLFVKEVIVEKVKYVGTIVGCDASDCMENENRMCSISGISVRKFTDDNGHILLSCDEYCPYDKELIDDTNKLILKGK